jgi:hypothetical protein
MNINIKFVKGYNTKTHLNGKRITSIKQIKDIGIWSIIKMFFNKKSDSIKIEILHNQDLIGKIEIGF